MKIWDSNTESHPFHYALQVLPNSVPASPLLSDAALSAPAAAEPKEAPLRPKRSFRQAIVDPYDGSSEEDTEDEELDPSAAEEQHYQQAANGAHLWQLKRPRQ